MTQSHVQRPETTFHEEDECRYWMFRWDRSVIAGVTPTHIFQAYLRPNERIRIYDGTKAVHTVKQGKGGGGGRSREANTVMLLDEARRILERNAICGLEKLRYAIPADASRPDGHVWEIDLYQGPGLGAAKLEVERTWARDEVFPPPLPPWAFEAADVTDELSDYAVACVLRDFPLDAASAPARLLQAVRAFRRMRR
jgi:CYTH domain-containing protein